MERRRLKRLAAIAVLGFACASETLALGLARARGAVIIGRPLNVTIAATLEPGDPDSPCAEADVFHGDTRISPRNVVVRWEPGAGGQGEIRVMSTAAVDEPVVTIYLRVGCSSKITRRYVLLADEPPEAAAQPSAQAAQAPAAAVGVPVIPLAPAQRSPAAGRAPGVATPAPVAPQAQVTAEPLRIQPAQRLAPAQRSATRDRAAAAGRQQQQQQRAGQAAQARLKLEPLDLTPPSDATLRTSGRLEAAPTDDPEKRRQAAALWRALTAGPEEAMRNSERLQVLERDMKSLFELTRRNALALEAMREQTEKARGERNVIAQLAIFLLVLVILAAVAGAFLLRRSGLQAPAWWRRRSEARDSDFASDFVAEPQLAGAAAVADGAPAAAPGSAAAKKAARDSQVPDIDLSVPPQDERAASAGASSAPGKYKPSFSTSRWGNSEFQASYPGGGGSSRMLKAEELIDIQQQADFFLSIDQPDRAVALLESHLEQDDTSALAWVDLLAIYHQLGRREQYESLREGFHARFNARVPAFEEFTQEQDGLEKYGRALSRIVSLWPSRRVLDVIEESLLRRPDDKDSEAFDLEAYRELVLLYNIGKELQTMEAEGPPSIPQPASFGDTSMLSLSALQAAAAGQDIDFGAATEPGGLPMPVVEDLELTSESLGLDIDLGDFGASQAPAPTPTPTPAPLMDLDSLDWRSIR